MASVVKIHDCSKCKLCKRRIPVDVDVDDMKVYHQIQVRMDNSKQAIRSDTINEIIGVLSKEEQEQYYLKEFKNDDEVQELFIEWWQLMKKKYNLDDSTKVDFEQNFFFQCIDEHGNPSFTGNFVPKDGVDLNLL